MTHNSKFLTCHLSNANQLQQQISSYLKTPPTITSAAAKAVLDTGKSLSEALISASTNPQYDDRFFIELQVQYMKIPSSNLGRTCCVQILCLTFRTFFVHNMFYPCSAKRRTSDKDLPVPTCLTIYSIFLITVGIRISEIMKNWCRSIFITIQCIRHGHKYPSKHFINVLLITVKFEENKILNQTSKCDLNADLHIKESN